MTTIPRLGSKYLIKDRQRAREVGVAGLLAEVFHHWSDKTVAAYVEVDGKEELCFFDHDELDLEVEQ